MINLYFFLLLLYLLIYILSILGCRLAFRKAVKTGSWLVEDGRISVLWFVPAYNTIMAIMGLYSFNDSKHSKPPKNKFLYKFFNYDLKS